MSLYPMLYSISLDQEETVGEVGVWDDLGWSWRLRWRRTRFEWEALQEEDFFRKISTSIISREIKDNHIWGGDITGEFFY